MGFNGPANLDDGELWPIAFALIDLTPAGEAKIAALGEESGALSSERRMS